MKIRRFAKPKSNPQNGSSLNESPRTERRQTESRSTSLPSNRQRAAIVNNSNLETSTQDTTRNIESDLEKIYSQIRSSPSFSAKIADFLRKNDVHSKHRRIVKKKFPRRRIIVHFPYQIFMGDLIEYTQSDFRHANSNFGYILVIIDCFTKKAYARPVKKKNKFAVSNALQSILNELGNYPNTLITDEGLEFYNKNVREILDKYGIHHYSIKTKMKASIVERFNRTLRSRLQKYFYKNKTKRWIDVLDQMIDNYNNTPHRSIGMSPNEVSDDNSDQVFKKMFPDIDLQTTPRLSKGNIVRILKQKTIFEKGYTQNWSDELYKIKSVHQAAGRVWYKVESLEGFLVPGIKYYWELNLVAKHDN